MLRLVQFENGRYGLQNQWTGIVVDREWRTQFGATRAANRRMRKLDLKHLLIRRKKV